MNLTLVQSSQIHSIGYDAATKTLTIRFPRTDKETGNTVPGSVYRYANFDQEAFDAFMAAESKGSHFIKNIKPHSEKYPFTKLTDEQVAELVAAE